MYVCVDVCVYDYNFKAEKKNRKKKCDLCI
jgi:hypothetical protein